MTRPAALFTPEGRSKLAKVLVWGGKGHLGRSDIERRIEAALERIARAVEAEVMGLGEEVVVRIEEALYQPSELSE